MLLVNGPFSVAEAYAIFNGHFHTSPLGVVEKAGLPSDLRLIRHLSKTDSHGSSTNGWLDAAEFPMQYYSAVHCADFVRLLHVYFPFAEIFCPSCLPCAEVLPLLATIFLHLSSFCTEALSTCFIGRAILFLCTLHRGFAVLAISLLLPCQLTFHCVGALSWAACCAVLRLCPTLLTLSVSYPRLLLVPLAHRECV